MTGWSRCEPGRLVRRLTRAGAEIKNQRTRPDDGCECERDEVACHQPFHYATRTRPPQLPRPTPT
jgi:hypothetical protein